MALLNLIRYKNLLIIILLQVLLRYGLIVPILSYYDIQPALSHNLFIILVSATVLLAASGYVINDYFDMRIDRVNRPKKVIVGNIITRRSALLLHVLLTLTGVFMGLFISFIFRKESYALFFISIPVILWYYSTIFKKQMLIGNIIIALMTAMVPYLVVSVEFTALSYKYGEAITSTDACSTAWFWATGFAFFAFITNLVREIIKDMEDIKGDRAGGCHTLPIEMGIVNSKIVVNLLLGFMLASLWAVYIFVPEIRQIPLVLPYMTIILTLPVLFLMTIIHRAKRAISFTRAGTISKLVMLAGILFILLIGRLY